MTNHSVLWFTSLPPLNRAISLGLSQPIQAYDLGNISFLTSKRTIPYPGKITFKNKWKSINQLGKYIQLFGSLERK